MSWPVALTWGSFLKSLPCKAAKSQTEDTYLVNTFNFFVTEPRFGQGYALKKAVRTEGVEAGLSGKDGVGFYKDYRGVPVIGAYKWLPEFNMCIITEIDQAEAFAPIVRLAWIITGIAFAISLAAGLLGLFFARTITRPILTLQEGVVRFGQGQRDVLLSETRSDEIGVVAREFNQMASAISDQEVQLRNYSENLENIVRERTSALRESEERYRTTMMSVGDGVIATDTEGRVELLNPVAEALTGWQQEEARGKPLEEVFRIINEETRRTVENPVRRVMREGVVVGLANHTMLIAKNGTEYPIADSGAPIRHEKGESPAWCWFSAIRTREDAEKALRESEGRFRATFEQAAVGIAQVGLDGRWLRVNQRLCDIVGYSREELLQRTFQNITHPDDLNADQAYIQKAWRRCRRTQRKNATSAKIAHWFWINLTVGLVNNESGAPEYFVSVVEDITDRKRAEEEVHRLNESLEQRVQERTSQLEAANKEMEAFSYSVSHDLRAPLRAVDGYTRILLEDDTAHLNEDAQKICGNICDSAQRMGKLIDDLLAFSRLSQSRNVKPRLSTCTGSPTRYSSNSPRRKVVSPLISDCKHYPVPKVTRRWSDRYG